MKIVVKDANVETLRKTQQILNNFRFWCKVKYDMADSTAKLMFEGQDEQKMEREIKEICTILSKEVDEKLHKIANPNRRVWLCIEATWSGYSSSQSRVVHREYRKIKQKDLQIYQDKAKESHRFDDNTCNYYRVYLCDRKGKDEKHGYDRLVKERFG